jgi:hypothetical protein
MTPRVRPLVCAAYDMNGSTTFDGYLVGAGTFLRQNRSWSTAVRILVLKRVLDNPYFLRVGLEPLDATGSDIATDRGCQFRAGLEPRQELGSA